MPAPVRAGLAGLRRALRRTLGAVEAWAVGDTHFRCLDCADPACCPPEGWEVSRLTGTAAQTEMVFAGACPLPSREALAALPWVSSQRRRSARRAAARARAGPAQLGGAQLQRWIAAVEQVTAGIEPSSGHLGRLGVALETPRLRDAALLWLLPGFGATARRLVAAGGGGFERTAAEVGRAMESIVTGNLRPDDPGSRAPAGVRLLEFLAAHLDPPARVAPLALLALLAWWGGQGSLARVRVEQALAVAPADSLARLVETILLAGLPPGWVRAEARGTI